MKEHKHEWVVFSTALKERWLMVQCVDCGCMGTVDDPTKDEWSEAFAAPSNPYRWHNDTRVTVRHNTWPVRYVSRWEEGPECNCRPKSPHQPQYERVPAEIMRLSRRVTKEEKRELKILAELVQVGVCSTLFLPLVQSSHEVGGRETSPAIREAVQRIDSIHRQGMHLRPTMVARVLREIAKGKGK